jgi:hypothetical protein
LLDCCGQGFAVIKASVGKGGVNRSDDTKAVQRLLSDVQIAAGAMPLTVDGLVGPRTIGAILAFQQQHPALPRDGRIDPQGPTLVRLDQVCANLYATIAQQQGEAVLRAFPPLPFPTPHQTVFAFRAIGQGLKELRPTAAVSGASHFASPVPNVGLLIGRFRFPLLGAVQAVPVIIALILILAMLVVITSNPIWQRAAKDFVKGLKDRMRLLSQKIRDAVQEIVDAIDKVIGGTACAEVCAPEISKVKELQRQINGILDRMPANDNDPDAIKQLQFQLARLLEQIVAAQQAVVDCLIRNGC